MISKQLLYFPDGMKIYYRKICKWLVPGAFLFLVCGLSIVLSVSAAEGRESDYSVYTRGIKVGELKAFCSFVQVKEKRALQFKSTT